MKRTVMLRTIAAAFLTWVSAGVLLAEQHFPVETRLLPTADSNAQLQVVFRIPAGYHLYKDQMSVKAQDGVVLQDPQIPSPLKKFDANLQEDTLVYEKDVTFTYRVPGPVPKPLKVTVELQGCSESTCFMPETLEFTLDGSENKVAPPTPPAAEAPTGEKPAVTEGAPVPAGSGQLKILVRGAGYLPPQDFVRFLEAAESGTAWEENKLAGTLQSKGIWITLLLILAGGLALNLTPCVLPMIPINIAIIGAGVQSGSRARGVLLGAAYGAGIAIVYGILGLMVVLTGAKFGSLNSSAWFNFAIAILFVAMSLAMFDIVHIDFSRFQSGAGSPGARRGSVGLALFMGGVAALLAGACVAPVLISVLILAADLYAKHNPAGLLLPFFLGLGMAIPWPFAGAGLSFLPKPGKWMNTVKYAFGVLILAFAAWYGYLGYSLIRGPSASGTDASSAEGQWMTSIEEGIRKAEATGQPLFVDFWATWCKNCHKMEKTTFRDPSVVQKLKPYIKVKFQAENMRDPVVRQVLDRYGVIGLPTYVVLGKPAKMPSTEK